MDAPKPISHITTRTAGAKPPAWRRTNERGSLVLTQFMVGVALYAGRWPARLLLPFICCYFYLSAPKARKASRAFLKRALGKQVVGAQSLRHMHTFASTLLDRVFFLNAQYRRFQISSQGEQDLAHALEKGRGAILLGSHMGSFDAIRALGRMNTQYPMVLMMYQENAKKIAQILNAINPKLQQEIIGLGELDCMIRVAEKLDAGAMVGILADRSLKHNEDAININFMGSPAAFSDKPLRLAALLRRPVFLMLGIYEGSNNYRIIFEPIVDFASLTHSRQRQQEVRRALEHYVARLEYYARQYPYNWFNFYDYWQLPSHSKPKNLTNEIS